MKFLILNSSGNVGKTLITREFLYPRLKAPLIIEVETVNRGNAVFPDLNVFEFEKSQRDFSMLYLKILENENVIVDVGASNLAQFWAEMAQFQGFETNFDYFIIPTIANDKIQTDTAKTITFLRSYGIPDSKIKVLFNKVIGNDLKDFAPLLSFNFDFDKSFYLKDAPFLNELGILKKQIKDIFVEDLDHYKSKILSASNPNEKILLIKSDLANRQAHSFVAEMDTVFEEQFGAIHKKETPMPKPGAEKPKKEQLKKNEKSTQADETEEDL